MYNYDPEARKKSQRALQKMFPRTDEGFAALIHGMLYFQYIPLYIYYMKSGVNGMMPPEIQREYKKPVGIENEVVEELVKVAVNECGRKAGDIHTNSYHAKVLRLSDAEQIINLEEDLDLGTLEKNILPYDTATEAIISCPDRIAVIDCVCRNANGKDGCYPRDVCFVIGEPWVSWAMDRDRYLNGRLISKEEALQILKECHERGNVHAGFFKDVAAGRIYSICNCCPCCCTALQAQNYIGAPMMIGSGLKAKVDLDKCKGCGLCAKKCNFLAITMGEDKKPQINTELCCGCEACQTHCKSGAISFDTMDPKVLAPLDIKALKAAQGK